MEKKQKKIVALVYGSYRTFDYVIKFWNEFIDKLDIDFYFITWNKSYTQYSPINEKYTRHITPNMITDNLSVKNLLILDEEQFNEEYYGIKKFDYVKNTQERMTFLWKRGLDLIKQSNESYDAFILMRPDIVYKFGNPIDNFFQNMKEKTFYTLTQNGVKFIEDLHFPKTWDYYTDDVLFISDFNSMCTFIETFPDRVIKGVHFDPAFHILKLGFKSEQITGVTSVCVRLNVLDIQKEEFNDYNLFSFQERV